MDDNITTQSFFIPANKINHIDESRYSMLTPIIDTLKSVERNTNKRLYVIDYYKRDIPYVSDNIGSLYGEGDRDGDKRSYLIEHIPADDLKMMVEITNSFFKRLYAIPADSRTDALMSIDFHIRYNCDLRLVNQTMTPLALTDDERIWLALCTLSLASNKTPGNATITYGKDDKRIEIYSHDDHQWHAVTDFITLNEYERTILIHSAQGYTVNEISEKICKSIDTVKTIKRSLFQKMDVKNISEAITKAQNMHIL